MHTFNLRDYAYSGNMHIGECRDYAYSQNMHICKSHDYLVRMYSRHVHIWCKLSTVLLEYCTTTGSNYEPHRDGTVPGTPGSTSVHCTPSTSLNYIVSRHKFNNTNKQCDEHQITSDDA